MIYSPAEDSYLLEAQIKNYAKGKSVLDMGSGSGILAKAALDSGAKSVIAVDINKESIEHIKSLGIHSIKSDLFKNVKGKFDLVIFNPPYLPEDKNEDKESRLATTGGKKGDEVIIQFLNQASKHLAHNGKILLLLSSLTPRGRITSILKKNNLNKKIISSCSLFMESLEVWEISKNT